jgi:hypothetical protein
VQRRIIGEAEMKTTKGIAITFLGDGGVCIRADWYRNGENILIAGKDYTPKLLHRVVENLRQLKKCFDNIYK